MRGSRETELAAIYPLHVVTKWLGNSPKIALRPYLQVTDADFEQGARMVCKSGTESGRLNAQLAQKAAPHAHAGNCKESQENDANPLEYSTSATP